MKKQHLLLSLLALLFTVLCVQEAVAKTEPRQDALYIFRNDGGFDFFFYGDIDRICYSKIDTSGVEQPDYVVQEVWAMDSVFRIPLTAIDSVAFVTPENIVWPDVFCPDDRIADYIIDGDSIWWIRLAHNTPADLLPTVGGKMLIEAGVSQFIPNGFGGRVAVVEHEEDGWLIATEPTAITDIYQRLVAKAAGATPGAQARHRASRRGWIDGDTYGVPETTFDIFSLDKEYTLSNNVISTPDEAPVSISADLSGSWKINYRSDVTLRACLFIDVISRQFKFDEKCSWWHSMENAYSLEGSLSGRFEWGKKKKKEFASDFAIEFGAGLYVEGSIGGYKVSKTIIKETEYINRVVMTSNDFIIDNAGMILADPTVNHKVVVHEDTTEYVGYLPFSDGAIQPPNTMSIGTGLYIKAETKLGMPLEKAKEQLPEFLVEYMRKYALNEQNDSIGFNCEAGLDLGGKLDMKAPWNVFLWEEPPLLESQAVFKRLNDESEFTASLYAKYNASLKLGPWSFGEPPVEKAMTSRPRGLVPSISGVRVATDTEQDPIKPYVKRFVSPITRDLMMPVDIGFVVIDEDHEIVAKKCDLSWFSENIFNQNIPFFKNGTYQFTMNIDPGRGEPVKYTAYPMVRLSNGHELLADKEYTFEVEPAAFDIARRIITVGPQSGMVNGEYVGSIDVEVIPNMENVEVNTEDTWLRNLIWSGDQNELSFFWDDLPDGMRSRRGVIRLMGLSQKGVELVEDSIVVIQSTAYIVVEPNKMEFPVEGGTKVATIIETSVSNITPTISPNNYIGEIHVSINGNTITVTADDNTDGDSRSAWVVLKGTGPDGLPVESYAIEITQEGLGGDDPGTFEPTTKRMLWDTNISYDVATRIVTQDTTYYDILSGGGSFYHDEHDNDDNWYYYNYKEDITDSGTSLHVKLYSKETPMQNGMPDGSYDVVTLSFDILNYNNIVVGERQISNIRHERKSYLDNELYGSWEIEIANLPITDYYDSEIEGYHQQSITAGGTTYGGVNIISGKVTYYVPDEDGEIHVLNYPFSVDHPDNTVEFGVDFFGDFGEYYFWNEEIGEYLPEGVNPGDWDPDDPDWDKAKTIDNPKVTIGSKMKKRAKLLNKRIGNNKND